jgi:hypothetical protein
MDSLKITGLLRVYEFSSDEEMAEYANWWHRFSLAEKARKGHLVVEKHNLVTSAGRNQLLTFAGASGTTSAFAQYYAVGTGAIATVTAADTQLATELFRAAPSSSTIVGTTVTITTQFTTGQANGTYTNAGLWGGSATSTLGSGTLMTHILYSYTKTSANAIYNDYTISLT